MNDLVAIANIVDLILLPCLFYVDSQIKKYEDIPSKWILYYNIIAFISAAMLLLSCTVIKGTISTIISLILIPIGPILVIFTIIKSKHLKKKSTN